MKKEDYLLGFIDGVFFMGVSNDGFMVDVMALTFQEDGEGGTSMNLVNPLPMPFISDGGLFLPKINVEKFTYFVNLNIDVDNQQGMIEYYKDIKLKNQEAIKEQLSTEESK